LKSASQRALYNNLDKDEGALTVDAANHGSRMVGWRANTMKTKKEALTDIILDLAKHQNDYSQGRNFESQ
jgi:hypothetical protein